MQHHHDCVGQLGTYEGSGMFDRVTVEEPTMAKCNSAEWLTRSCTNTSLWTGFYQSTEW
jgi:hypothetical protein